MDGIFWCYYCWRRAFLCFKFQSRVLFGLMAGRDTCGTTKAARSFCLGLLFSPLSSPTSSRHSRARLTATTTTTTTTTQKNHQGDIFFNYGCFPRTWEDPDHVHPDTGYQGDNDPLDVCEIGLRIVATGDVRQVKVLGVLAMIDEGERHGGTPTHTHRSGRNAYVCRRMYISKLEAS